MRVCSCALQGHSGNVTCLDFSSNGKYLASCADDRTVRIWSTKDFLEREHKYLRANVELDHATLVRFSPDSRSRCRSLNFIYARRPSSIFKLTPNTGTNCKICLLYPKSLNQVPNRTRENVITWQQSLTLLVSLFSF